MRSLASKGKNRRAVAVAGDGSEIVVSVEGLPHQHDRIQSLQSKATFFPASSAAALVVASTSCCFAA
jgi:hypothetical protein